MKEMARLAEERNINRRMTNAIKGNRQSVNTVEIPKYDWFYSEEKKRYTITNVGFSKHTQHIHHNKG